MEIIGIITEYNPFHNGHIYHIKKIKELYPNSLIILVLNGLFLERGEISILTKEAKTKIALNNNIDLVLELPILFGTQSGDTFADISIKILNNFKVTKLIFGSESNNIDNIKKIANEQINNKEYDEQVKLYLKEGINYPTALAKSLNQKDFTFLPNDLLAISYVKSIINNSYNIEPITIKRTNNYLDTTSYDNIISATNIREKIIKGIDITNYVPSITKDNIININYNLLFTLLKYKINTDPNLNIYLDVNEGIEHRIKSIINDSSSLEDLIQKIKTKRYTYNKIKRMLTHILLGIKKEDKDINLDYIRILGFNKKGQSYLNKIKDTLDIPTVINNDSIIYNYELIASTIYDLINNTNTINFEKNKQPIITD